MKSILVVIFLSVAFTVSATPIAYEGFDYPLSPTNLVGHATTDGFTWDQAGPSTGGTNVPAINASSLSYPGLAPSIGNSVKFGGIDSGGMAARFSLKSPVTSGTLYYSFIVKVTDITGLSASGVFWAGFNNSVGPQPGLPAIVGTRVVTKTSGVGFQIGLDKSSGGAANFQFDTNVFNVGDTIFIVGCYTFNAGINDDVSTMWVNPDPANFGAASSPTTNVLTATVGNDLTGNQIASFCLFNRNAAEPQGIILDELTIGTTWADVTPTAASLAIVSHPKDQRVVAGASATFNATTYRASTWKWQHNTVDVPGATTTTLTLNNVQLGDAGNYQLVAGNGVTTVTSSNATLTVKPDIYPRLAPIWSLTPFARPYITTDPSQTPMERYFAFNTLSNQVLIVSRTNTSTLASTGMVYVLNADTGADLYQMDANSSVIAGGLSGITLSSIDVADDGAIYAANISDAGTGVSFRAYRWDNSGPGSGPVNIYDGDPFGLGIERYGDSLAVRGAGTTTEILLDDSRGLYGAILKPTDGTMATFFTSAFTNVIGGLTGGRTVRFAQTNTFWEKHRGAGLQLASYDLTGFSSSVITNYSNFPSTLGVCGFNFNLNLLCGINFLDNTNAPDTLDLFDISDPSLPVYIASYNFPTNSQANANRVGRVVFSGDRVFALDGNNGFLAFAVVPRLYISNSGVLSWPTNFTGYALQATPSLSPLVTWTNVGLGTIVGQNYQAVQSFTGARTFYRLKKP